jgi:hypothetical protein
MELLKEKLGHPSMLLALMLLPLSLVVPLPLLS